jgi:predicted fused transcriptional regulator/phosphomethylpyrimidine kinase
MPGKKRISNVVVFPGRIQLLASRIAAQTTKRGRSAAWYRAVLQLHREAPNMHAATAAVERLREQLARLRGHKQQGGLV